MTRLGSREWSSIDRSDLSVESKFRLFHVEIVEKTKRGGGGRGVGMVMNE
jgi:hypothetical protein